MLRASGSKLGQRARKKSIYNPLALRSLQDFESRIRFSWESGNSWEGAAVETPTHDPSYPLSFQGRGDGSGWVQGLSRGLTGDADLDRDLSPAHIILCPACHILLVEITGDIDQS